MTENHRGLLSPHAAIGLNYGEAVPVVVQELVALEVDPNVVGAVKRREARLEQQSVPRFRDQNLLEATGSEVFHEEINL